MAHIGRSIKNKNGAAAPRQDAEYVARVLRVVDNFFPAGTPVPCATFLRGVIHLLEADAASLTLVRVEAKRKSLIAFDAITLNLHDEKHTRHRQNLMNQKAWDGDPVAKRLLGRAMRRPTARFTYSSGGWVKRNGWHDSFTAKVLTAVGWKSGITVSTPIDRRVFALLTAARFTERDFTRLDRRIACAAAQTFHKRLIEVRGTGLRDGLPKSLRQTFDFILSGVSEKEIAHVTRRNTNTVHDQVKRLYTHFGVSSRPQLMAKFIDPAKIRVIEA